MPTLPLSRPLLATKPAPPPADRKDTAGNVARPTPAPAPKPPPVVVEMPPPIPGPPLALAAADAPGPPPRKPTPPARKLQTRALSVAPVSPAVVAASASVRENAPRSAASAQVAAVDPELSAEEIALILAHREQVAQALYHPGEWDYGGATLRAPASASRKMPPAEEWTAVDTTGSPLPAAMPAAAVEVSYSARLAQPQTEAAVPTRLADLTPDEQRLILARRGVHEARPAVRVAIKVKVLETEDPAQYLRSGSPAVPIDTPLPDVPAALLQQKGDWMMVARVHVARNGATDITITRPIADPVLNRAVDQALSRWRFRPSSVAYGQPEDSTIKLSVKVSVG